MSEPTAGEVLEMLAKWEEREADASKMLFHARTKGQGYAAQQGLWEARVNLIGDVLRDLRALAASLTPPAPASASAEVGERPALWAEHQSLRLGGGYHNPQQCRLMEKLVDLDTALDIQAQAVHGVALARERLRWQREVLKPEATP